MNPRNAKAAADAIDDFLRALGLDPSSDPSLAGTSESVARTFAEDLCSGYDVDAVDVLRTDAISIAPHAGPSTSEVVVLRDLAVTTTCPHHLMPATGFATVAFAPRASLVGIGAIGRALDGLSRRLTLQEDIGRSLTGAILTALSPAWVGCRIALSHSCLTARGERRHGTSVETISLAGSYDEGIAHRLLASGAQCGR